jgi:hypothetical protein
LTFLRRDFAGRVNFGCVLRLVLLAVTTVVSWLITWHRPSREARSALVARAKTSEIRRQAESTQAAWIRGHCEIENKHHWVRDVTCQEDKSLVRTENAPRVMASPRGLAISLPRLDGHADIAAANRHHARDPQRTLKLLQTA